MFQRPYRICLFIVISVVLCYCAGSQPKHAAGGKKQEKQERKPSEDGSPNEGSDSADADSGEEPTEESEESEEDDLDSFDEEGGEDGTAAAQALIEDCGVADLLSAAPDQIIVSKSMRSLQVEQTVFTITVKATTNVKVEVTPLRTIQESKVTIDSVEGFLSTFAQGTADETAASKSGIVTMQNLKTDEMMGIGDRYTQWKGVTCTFTAASKLKNQRGGENIDVSFDPPIPANLSPRAVAKRYQEEIGSQRVFQNISATVGSSSNVDLPAGSKVSGSISVQQIDPTLTATDATGRASTVKADVAYRMTYSFGTPATTFLLGLPPEVTYYISHAKKDVIATIIDSKEEGTPPVVFLTP